MHHGEPAIHGRRRRLWLLVELRADVFEEGGIVDFGQGQWEQPLGPPAGEVQQVKSVGAQGTQRELANALRVEECIGPSDLLAVLIEQAIRGDAGQNGRSIDQK